jgi:hypothetical protein
MSSLAGPQAGPLTETGTRYVAGAAGRAGVERSGDVRVPPHEVRGQLPQCDFGLRSGSMWFVAVNRRDLGGGLQWLESRAEPTSRA